MDPLTAEQEVHVRTVIANRLNRMRDETPYLRQSEHTKGYNEALRDAVVEVMGGPPLYIPSPRTMIDGPGGGSEPDYRPLRVISGRTVEDLELPEEPPTEDDLAYLDGWGTS